MLPSDMPLIIVFLFIPSVLFHKKLKIFDFTFLIKDSSGYDNLDALYINLDTANVFIMHVFPNKVNFQDSRSFSISSIVLTHFLRNFCYSILSYHARCIHPKILYMYLLFMITSISARKYVVIKYLLFRDINWPIGGQQLRILNKRPKEPLSLT